MQESAHCPERRRRWRGAPCRACMQPPRDSCTLWTRCQRHIYQLGGRSTGTCHAATLAANGSLADGVAMLNVALIVVVRARELLEGRIHSGLLASDFCNSVFHG